jgi:uncharacterized membrane protein YidH (DUF202 family)
MLPPPMPVPARGGPPGPRLITSLVVTGIGVVIAAISVIIIVIPLVGTLTSPSYAVPGDIRVHLRHANYTVYQHTGTRSTFGSTHDDNPPAIRMAPSALAVTAPDDSSVPVEFDGNDETLTRGSNVYSGALTFRVPSSGEYDLTFTNPTPTTVVIARSLSDAVRSVAAWFAGAALGAAIAVGGVIMLIVGMVRRGRAKRAMYGGWGPPPGSGPPWPGPYPPQQYPPQQYPPQWGGPPGPPGPPTYPPPAQ